MTYGEATLGAEDVRRLVLKEFNLPDEARVDVFVMVPAGGDYSGERLSIDEDFPIRITYVIDDA